MANKKELLNKANDYVNKNKFNKALKIYFELAREGNTEALFKLGEAYSEGKGVERDLFKASEYYRQAIDLGYTDVYGCLYVSYCELGREQSEYKERALKCLYEMMNIDDYNKAKASYIFCGMYLNGEEVEKDIEKAIEYGEFAISHGFDAYEDCADAYMELGLKDKYIDCLERGCRADCKEAKYRLANTYFKGEIVKKDLNKALQLSIECTHYYPDFYGIKSILLASNVCIALCRYQDAYEWLNKLRYNSCILYDTLSSEKIIIGYMHIYAITREEKCVSAAEGQTKYMLDNSNLLDEDQYYALTLVAKLFSCTMQGKIKEYCDKWLADNKVDIERN